VYFVEALLALFCPRAAGLRIPDLHYSFIIYFLLISILAFVRYIISCIFFVGAQSHEFSVFKQKKKHENYCEDRHKT